MNLFIRQLFESISCTYTYLIWDDNSREAALIDSVDVTQVRDQQLIEELGLNLKYILETHIHADHVTAAKKHREVFSAKVMLSEHSQSDCADHLLIDKEIFYLGEQAITALYTPGHTNTCLSYLIDGAVFTGDTLLIRGTGRTDFQAGNAEIAFHSIRDKLYTLADETKVYPGHDYQGLCCSTIGEEKRFNPRIKSNTRCDEYVALMDALDIPNPKKIDIALPKNMQCGGA